MDRVIEVAEEKNSPLGMFQSGTINYEVYETLRYKLDGLLSELAKMGG